MPWGDRVEDETKREAAAGPLALRLRNLAAYAGVSTSEFAGAFGVTRMTMHRYMTYKSAPRTLARIEDMTYDVAKMYEVLKRMNWPDMRPPKGAERDLVFGELLAEAGWEPTWQENKREARNVRARTVFTWVPPQPDSA